MIIMRNLPERRSLSAERRSGAAGGDRVFRYRNNAMQLDGIARADVQPRRQISSHGTVARRQVYGNYFTRFTPAGFNRRRAPKLAPAATTLANSGRRGSAGSGDTRTTP